MSDQASARVTPISPAKLRANRRNARKSTGPRTAEGKKTSSRNATTHGLFCRDLVLPGEEADRFHLLRESILRALKPQDAMELALVDRLVCDQWRLNRLQRAEMALYAHRDEELRDRRRKEMEKLERDFQFSDVTSACQVASHLLRDFRRYEELKEALAAEPAPAAQLAAALMLGDAAFDRLSRYEQRLQHGVHRCLRDLHALRAKAEKYRDLPESPFLVSDEVIIEDEEPQHEPAAVEDANVEGGEREVAARASSHVQNEPTAAAPIASPDAASDYTADVNPNGTPEGSRG
jgi:hypothetical protein